MQSRIVFASILGCIALTIVVVLWIGDTHPRLPEVPNPDLSQAFPEVARAIEEQRKVVLSDSQSGAEWGRYAMLLDMNALEHTYLSLLTPRSDGIGVEHLISGMEVLDKTQGGRTLPRFVAFADNRDFFYLTRKEPEP